MNDNSTQVRGFTLVELLVVIAIIGVLIALLLPAVQAAREAARKASCKNNLRQLGLAVLNYESTNGELPPGYEYLAGDEGNVRGYSWASRILPYLEQRALYDRIDFNKPVFDDVNIEARIQSIPTLLCPTDTVFYFRSCRDGYGRVCHGLLCSEFWGSRFG